MTKTVSFEKLPYRKNQEELLFNNQPYNLFYNDNVDNQSSKNNSEIPPKIDVHENSVEMKKYKPVVTRPTMSKYEFVHTITAAAKYLYSLTNIEKFCGNIEINSIINPAELAFNLLMEKRLDAVITRLSYEKVNFSELIIDNTWIETIKNYFKNKHQYEEEELLKPFGLL